MTEHMFATAESRRSTWTRSSRWVGVLAMVAAGIATVKTWKYRIVDAEAIPREYLMIDEKKLGAYARAMKEGAKVAGVEFYAEETLSSKGY